MLCKPVSGPITSRYGWRIINGVQNFHNGIDYGWLNADIAGSRKVYSAAPGLVVDAGYGSEPGNYVLVDLGNGYKVRYIHLASDLVTVGQRVGYSTPIGTMGDTGTATSPGQIHLHLDLYKTSTRVNPQPHVTLPFGYTGNSLAGGGGEPIDTEDDMYDNSAEQRLIGMIQAEGRPVKLYQWGSGIVAIGRGGREWIVPSQAYIDLLDYLKLASKSIVPISNEQHDFLVNISSILNPTAGDDAVDAVINLSPEQVEALASQISQATETALADNFARIPADVNNDLKNRL